MDIVNRAYTMKCPQHIDYLSVGLHVACVFKTIKFLSSATSCQYFHFCMPVTSGIKFSVGFRVFTYACLLLSSPCEHLLLKLTPVDKNPTLLRVARRD